MEPQAQVPPSPDDHDKTPLNISSNNPQISPTPSSPIYNQPATPNITPNIYPTVPVQPVSPQLEADNQQKPGRLKWRYRILITFNIIPILLYSGLFLWLSSLQNSGVSGTEFIAIILAPVIGLLFLIVLIIDFIVCLRLFLKNRKNPLISQRKKYLPLLGVLIPILIICYNAYQIKGAVNESRQITENVNFEEGESFKKTYSLVEQDKNYKFDLLLPTNLPTGYKYRYGQVSYAEQAEDVYFEANYTKQVDYEDSHDFSIRMFKVRDNFSPPQNCGYPLSPPKANSEDTLKAFPCTEIKSLPNNKIYYLSTEKDELGYSPAEDIYYTLKADTVVIVDTVKSSKAITKDDVAEMLATLKAYSLDEIIQLNNKNR